MNSGRRKRKSGGKGGQDGDEEEEDDAEEEEDEVEVEASQRAVSTIGVDSSVAQMTDRLVSRHSETTDPKHVNNGCQRSKVSVRSASLEESEFCTANQL